MIAHNKNQKGYILILGIVVMAILMTMSSVVWGYTALQVKSSRHSVAKAQALHIAEAGIDKALNELNTDSNFAGESSVALDEGTYTTTVSSVDPNNKQVTSTASIPNAANPVAEVTVKVNVTLDLSSVAFNFGVQVGTGGLQMDNNSQINGNVYSNGNIYGGNGIITGDATVAGGGSATADQECTTNNSNFAFNQTDRRDVAQKFTPSVSGPLTRISVYLRKNGSPSDITVRIMTNNSNQPSKTQVGGSGTISGSLVTTSYGWIDATFSSTPNLNAGTAYWIVLDTSSSATNYYTWARDTSDASCSGTGTYSANWNAGTPVWTQTNSDFNIRTYMGGVPTSLANIQVNGNARANIMQSCNVGGNAYYSSTNTCTVTGTTYPGTSDSPQAAMPISQAQIDEWKSVALSGGTTVGTYTVNGTVTMGPQKIEGDLTINGTLYLTGPVWVEGNITMNNNSAVRIDTSMGNAGTVLLADDPSDPSGTGYIDIYNNVIIAGNNNPGSYPMIVTTKSGSAMNISNNAAGAIFYASNGTINVANNAGGAQVTGYGIHLNNNATITYSIGLQSATFANGPGGAWAIVPGTYLILD
jgi:Tfp pilus assembly protein PilX